MKFAVFGLGNSLYSDYFNTIGKNCDKYLFQLSAERISPLSLGDENVSESKNGSIDEDFNVWKDKFLTNIKNRNNKGGKISQKPFFSFIVNLFITCPCH